METNIVEVYINYLRKKLGGDTGASRNFPHTVIRTVRGEGYLLIAPQGHAEEGNAQQPADVERPELDLTEAPEQGGMVALER
jgi:DNA-binding winged helix-turn-helix (wHTH) protein